MADEKSLPMPAGIDVNDDELLQELEDRNASEAERAQKAPGGASTQPPKTAPRRVLH
ncbi:MAG: hypothetical protein Q7R90_03655 [bacterium]|nr:hypothetical protein [bacterium]